ncbi:uncharacterized protein RG961_007021 [Leptosomus discolor]
MTIRGRPAVSGRAAAPGPHRARATQRAQLPRGQSAVPQRGGRAPAVAFPARRRWPTPARCARAVWRRRLHWGHRCPFLPWRCCCLHPPRSCLGCLCLASLLSRHGGKKGQAERLLAVGSGQELLRLKLERPAKGGEPPYDRTYRRGREERKRRKHLNGQILPAALRARDALPMAVFSFSIPAAPAWTAERSQGRMHCVFLEFLTMGDGTLVCFPTVFTACCVAPEPQRGSWQRSRT